MISFVIPAHNEEAYLPRTIGAIHESARACGQTYEIIAVDDASTDGTADVARKHGARVVSVQHRQIAATRNSGGRAALGDRLFFIDADTAINPRVVARAMRRMDKGAVGGGAGVKFEGALPIWAHLLNPFVAPFAMVSGVVGGACMFCTKQAFLDSGGFNEKLFCSEECFFTLALMRLGRFDVVWTRVMTSGRRLRTTSGLQIIRLVAHLFIAPLSVTRRAAVEKIWYDSNRKNDELLPNSLSVRISNGVMLALLLLLLTAPLRMVLPWKWTPLGTVMGDIRMLTGIPIVIIQCLFFWPCAVALTANLVVCLVQRRWGTNWVKSILVTAVCWYFAWDGAQEAVWLCANFSDWLPRLRLR